MSPAGDLSPAAASPSGGSSPVAAGLGDLVLCPDPQSKSSTGSKNKGGDIRNDVLADQTMIVLECWLRCCNCSGLQPRWCEDVLCPQPIDLVGSLGILGAYFYTPIRLCKTHLPLFARSVQLSIGQPQALYTRLNAMWEDSLSINHLAELVDNRRNWFVSPVTFSRSSCHNIALVEQAGEGDMGGDGNELKDGEHEENDEKRVGVKKTVMLMEISPGIRMLRRMVVMRPLLIMAQTIVTEKM